MKIQNTRDLGSDGIKIVVAGEAGNGKTTLARTLAEGLKGEKVCIVSAEAGLLSLRGSDIDVIDLQRDDEGKPIPKEHRLTRLGEVYHWLTQSEQISAYRWVFIDSLTEINQNMVERLEADPEFQGPKNTIKKYGELATRMRALAKNFRDLPHYNVVFTALVKEDTDNDGKKSTVIDMIGSFARSLPALFDEIFYLGVFAEVDANGRNRRGILTQKTDKLTFPKDRSGTLDRLEPADLAAIVLKIRSKVAATTAAVVANPEPQAPTLAGAAPAQVSATPPTPEPVPQANANAPAALVPDLSAAGKAAAKAAKEQKAAQA